MMLWLESGWLVPFFPLVAAGVTALFKNHRRKEASFLAIAAMGLSLLLSLALFAGFLITHRGSAEMELGIARILVNFTWFTTGETPEIVGFILDPLTLMMLLVVTIVSFLVFIYSVGYMHEDPNIVRFFCFLSLFAASMLGLVLSNHLLILFMCWELVGLCSYLLIGFWYQKPEAAAAAKKAFIVTRVGDIGFFIGLLLLYNQTGTLLLYGGPQGGPPPYHPGVLSPDIVHAMGRQTIALPLLGGVVLTTLLGILFFLGAMGKSAQFPLHIWLPDAMEGPTPVSALIHAATMVAAGVFLVGRMFPLLEGTGAMMVIAWVGGFTALFSATIAVAQWDIKRVLAYSTISQLGTMMMALGLGGYVAGLFHLMTHAFFKALLFLGSGSVIHGCHGEQDMRKMGGLRKEMPVTFWTYLIGTLALAGIFPLSGFWSKDEILLEAYTHHRPLYAIGTVTAFLTAFYMFRQIFLVFSGSPRGHGKAHESPQTMLWPLRVFAFFSIFSGFVGTSFHHFLAPLHDAPSPSFFVMILSTAVALLGILTAHLFYRRRPFTAEDPLALSLKSIFRILERKYYVDECFDRTLVRGTEALSRFFKTFDQKVIDGLLHRTGFVALVLSQFNQWCDNFFLNRGFDRTCGGIQGSGQGLRRIQSGRTQDYLFYAAAGAVLLYLTLRILGMR